MLKEHWLPVPRVQYLQYHQASAPRLSGLVRLSWVGKGKLGFEAGAPQTKQVRTQFDAGCRLLAPHDSDVGASMLWALSLHLISCESRCNIAFIVL